MNLKKTFITGFVLGLIIPFMLTIIAKLISGWSSKVTEMIMAGEPGAIGLKFFHMFNGEFLAIFPDTILVAVVYALLFTAGVWLNAQKWTPTGKTEITRTFLAFVYASLAAAIVLFIAGVPTAISLIFLGGILLVSAMITILSVFILDHFMRIVDV